VMNRYYPGDKYVDWIGADGYDRAQLGHDAFAQEFESWYRYYDRRGKPMMVTETGATTDQAEFLRGVADVLPTNFTRIKAFLYFDAVGNTDWRLSSYGGAGIPAFAELGRNPYFAAMAKP
jgi:beta-mannanase